MSERMTPERLKELGSEASDQQHTVIEYTGEDPFEVRPTDDEIDSGKMLEEACREIWRAWAENEKLKEFANYVMANSFDGRDTDGGDAQDEAERLGLLEARPIPEEDSIDGEIEHYFLKWAPKEGGE